MDLRHVSSYWNRFDDGMPDGLAIVPQPEGWLVQFPNGASAEISGAEPASGWNPVLPKDGNTTRLWLRSLRYVPMMLSEGDESCAVGILENFSEHLDEALTDIDSIRSGSVDHQCALQLRTICDVVAYFSGSVLGLDRVFDICDSLFGKIVGVCEALDLLKPNNHGIMLGISLLHATEVFSSSVHAKFRVAVEEFLYKALSSIVGIDGVVNENTVMYQALYVDLFGDLHDYYEWSRFEEPDGLLALGGQVVDSYRRMLLPDGSLPPLGDGCRSFQSKVRPITGGLSSPDNGLHIWSDSNAYFSFVCGNRGVFHKQMDDTSLFLSLDGKALINDAGLGSYDATDPRAQAIRSQLGHSGLFFVEFDGIDPAKVINWGQKTRLVRAGLEVAGGHPGSVKGTVDFRGARTVRRLIWSGDREFCIRDSIEPSVYGANAVSRFVLDPDAQVSVKGSEFRIQLGGVWALIRVLDSESAARAVVYDGHLADGSKGVGAVGFVARRPYDIVPTKVIEVPVNEDGMPGSVELAVQFGRC